MTDAIRSTLDRIERCQRNFRLAVASAVIIEGLLIAALLWLTNFSDRVQALVFVSAVGGYTLMALGFVMVATHVDRTLLKALSAGR